MSELSCKLVSSDRELEAAFEIRRQVFGHEQGISEDLVLDGHDREALQMVVVDEDAVIGTARVQFLPGNQAKIERMAVLEPLRRKGIGREILSFLDEELKSRNVKQVVLHAQYPVVHFYKACGFEEKGLPFWEAGIKHIKMQKQL